jgi:hypothetical protein
MTGAEADAAEAMRGRLQADLRAAIKARSALEVGMLRVLIAAIDNAGAVPLAAGSAPPRSEVERRRLSDDDVQALLRREQETRAGAAREFNRLGRTSEAEQAEREAGVVGRYL